METSILKVSNIRREREREREEKRKRIKSVLEIADQVLLIVGHLRTANLLANLLIDKRAT